MSGPDRLDPVIEALRRALDAAGPGSTDVQALTADELAQLLPEGTNPADHNGVVDEVIVAVVDADSGAEETEAAGAVVVADRDHAVLLRPEFGASAVVHGLRAATVGLSATVRQLRAEAAVVDALHATGRRLTAQLDIGRLVQDTTDAATRSTGAAFGAFFYNLINQFGESYTLYTLSGVPRESFSRFPMPRNTEVFAPTFDGVGTVRSADITSDPRFGRNAPYHGMPEGHLPVRSYLAVPVISPTSGDVLGGFFFGHPALGRFTRRHEYLAEGIGAYAAIALDNARLFERERSYASELSRSLVPVVPDIPAVSIVGRYAPASTGAKVGGDWFDVIPLPSGATAFVIGDVVGHGVTAASIMAQTRAAIRAYALLEMPPVQLLSHVSRLVTSLSENSFITCFYAVYTAADTTLRYANAGHPPALLTNPDGVTRSIGEAMAQPLGVGEHFGEAQTLLPPGAHLVLFTDGLVESTDRDITAGISRLGAALPSVLQSVAAGDDGGSAWDRVITQMTGGHHDDDIAVLHVHHREGGEP